MLCSQLSVRGHFQDGSEPISIRCRCLTASFILHLYVAACTIWLVVYGALESVTVLWLPRNYHAIIIFFTLGIKDPEWLGKKMEENCRSDHYSGQSSTTKESCSSTPLNRCTSTEMRWNKKAVSHSSPEWWLIFLALCRISVLLLPL